jgi:tRNA-binding protein
MDFTAVELRVCTVAAATLSDDGRALHLTLRLGPADTREATAHITERYDAEGIVGRQVLAVLSGPEPVVLAAVTPADGAVLLSPDTAVPDGTLVV